jgi:hypothetical protein
MMMVSKLIGRNARRSALKTSSKRPTIVIGKVGWTKPRQFFIGDRIQMSELGASRCPRLADKIGTIVGRSIYVNSVGVLFDGNKSSRTVHCNYLESLETSGGLAKVVGYPG